MTSRGGLGQDSGVVPITLWPPGFSMAIALGIVLGRDPLDASAWVLAVSYVACVLCAFACAYAATRPRSFTFAAIAATFFALMPGTLQSLDAVLSDLPFTCALAATALLATKVAEREHPSKPLQFASGLLTGSCFWFRYIGLGMVVGTSLALLSSRRGETPWARVRPLSTTLLTSAAVCVALVARNALVAGHPLGEHAVRPSNVVVHVLSALDGCVYAAAPPLWAASTIARIAMVASVIAAFAVSFRSRSWRAPSVRVLGGMFVAYVASLLSSASLTAFNSLDDARFWVPFWLLFSLFSVAVLGATSGAYRRFVAVPTFVAMTACILVYVAMVLVFLPVAQKPYELSDPDWRKAASLLPAVSECHLLSNDVRPFLVHRPVAPSGTLPDDRERMDDVRRAHPRLCVAFVKGWTPASTRVHRLAQEALVHAMFKQGQLSLIARDALVDVYRVAP